MLSHLTTLQLCHTAAMSYTSISQSICVRGSPYHRCMSTAEIIRELPRLSEAERRAVREKLLELATQDEDVKLCDAAAIEGTHQFDQMEDDDARRPQR